MAELHDLAAERERIAQRLARIDAERTKLAEELAELEAAERVLARFGGSKARNGRRRTRQSAPSEARAATEPQRRRGGRGRRKAPAKPEIPLGEATLRAVEALGNAVSAEQVQEYLGREFGMQVRANHLVMALQRHRRAGRLHQDDGRWTTPARGSAEIGSA